MFFQWMKDVVWRWQQNHAYQAWLRQASDADIEELDAFVEMLSEPVLPSAECCPGYPWNLVPDGNGSLVPVCANCGRDWGDLL